MAFSAPVLFPRRGERCTLGPQVRTERDGADSAVRYHGSERASAREGVRLSADDELIRSHPAKGADPKQAGHPAPRRQFNRGPGSATVVLRSRKPLAGRSAIPTDQRRPVRNRVRTLVPPLPAPVVDFDHQQGRHHFYFGRLQPAGGAVRSRAPPLPGLLAALPTTDALFWPAG